MIFESNIKYYEVHITIEPVEGALLEHFECICKNHAFRHANLIMVKKRKITDERSDKDQFCTGRFLNYKIAKYEMDCLRESLQANGFKVWRNKIEAVLYDERYK